MKNFTILTICFAVAVAVLSFVPFGNNISPDERDSITLKNQQAYYLEKSHTVK